MSEIKILSQENKEQNEFYDVSRSNDGGGYSQPRRTTIFEYEGETYEFIYNSTSCGGFGARFSKTLYKDGVAIASLYVNHVDDNIWESSFYWNNPLHVAMYEAGLLKKSNFSSKYE